MTTTSDWMSTMQQTLTDLVGSTSRTAESVERIEESMKSKVDKEKVEDMVKDEVTGQIAEHVLYCPMATAAPPIDWMKVLRNCAYIIAVGISTVATIYATLKGLK